MIFEVLCVSRDPVKGPERNAIHQYTHLLD